MFRKTLAVFGGLMMLAGCSTIPLPQSLNPLTTRVVSSTAVVGGNFSIVKDVVTGQYSGIASGSQTAYPIVSTAPALVQSMDGTGYTYLIVQGPSSTCSVRADIFAIRQADGRMAHTLMPDCGAVRGFVSGDGQTALFFENDQPAPRSAWTPARGVYRVLSPTEQQDLLRKVARRNAAAHRQVRHASSTREGASYRSAPMPEPEEKIEELDHVDDALLPHSVTEAPEQGKKVSTLKLQ